MGTNGRAASRRDRTKRTPFGKFYDSVVRPQFVKRYSATHVGHCDGCVNAAEQIDGSLRVEDIDKGWLEKFRENLKKAGRLDYILRRYPWILKRIVYEEFPYRFIAGMPWSKVKSALRAEPRDCFGRYYVQRYEPRSKFKPRSLHVYRNMVRRFHQWSGKPVALTEIDESLLQRFATDETDRGLQTSVVEQGICLIRRVVNHWEPGRLKTRSEQPDPRNWKVGSVQHYVESVVIPRWKFRDVKTRTIRHVCQRLYVFNGNKELTFEEFTPVKAGEFLAWRLKHGAHGHGKKQLKAKSLNKSDRLLLNRISNYAVSDARMPWPLRLDMLSDSKQRNSRYSYKTAGYERRTKRTAPQPADAAAEVLAPPPPPKQPRWDVESGQLTVGSRTHSVAPQAADIRTLLNTFEAAGWPEWVESPFREPKKHGNAIYKINRGQNFLRFKSVMAGTAISFEKIENEG